MKSERLHHPLVAHLATFGGTLALGCVIAFAYTAQMPSWLQKKALTRRWHRRNQRPSWHKPRRLLLGGMRRPSPPTAARPGKPGAAR